MRHITAGFLAILVLAAGCSAADPGPTTTGPPATTTPPSTTTTAAASALGGARPVEVHGEPRPGAPLLVLLHGFGDSGAGIYSAWGDAALAAGMVVIAPDGTMVEGRRFWNATSACCDFSGSGVDDVGYLTDVVDEARAAYGLGEVAVLGFSNGAFMAHRLACEASGSIDAIVAIAGALDADLDACDPDGPVRVLDIHGDADPVVRYSGVAGGAAPPPLDAGHPGAIETIEHWASVLACGSADQGADIDLEVGGEAETTVLAFGGCPSDAAAELWTVRGAGHGIAFDGDGRDLVLDWVNRQDARPARGRRR